MCLSGNSSKRSKWPGMCAPRWGVSSAAWPTLATARVPAAGFPAPQLPHCQLAFILGLYWHTTPEFMGPVLVLSSGSRPQMTCDSEWALGQRYWARVVSQVQLTSSLTYKAVRLDCWGDFQIFFKHVFQCNLQLNSHSINDMIKFYTFLYIWCIYPNAAVVLYTVSDV